MPPVAEETPLPLPDTKDSEEDEADADMGGLFCPDGDDDWEEERNDDPYTGSYWVVTFVVCCSVCRIWRDLLCTFKPQPHSWQRELFAEYAAREGRLSLLQWRCRFACNRRGGAVCAAAARGGVNVVFLRYDPFLVMS